MRWTASPLPAAVSQAPVTLTAATAAAHTSAADTRPPRRAAWPATRPQILPARLPVIRASVEADPAGMVQPGRVGRSGQTKPRHGGCPLPLGRGSGKAPAPWACLRVDGAPLPGFACLTTRRRARPPYIAE